MSAGDVAVLHVLNSASGGAAMSTIALMNELKPLGFSACAVCDDRGTAVERETLLNATGGRVVFTHLYWWNRKIRSKAWKRPVLEGLQLLRTGCRLLSTREVVKAARNWQVDLIHTNTLLTPEGGRASRWLGIPHIWHVRELVGPGLPFQFFCKGTALGAYLVKMADRIIANSSVAAQQLTPWTPENFVSIIPNGIDCSAFLTASQRSERKGFVVGMVASLSSRVKKHDLFIGAAGRVNPQLQVEWRIYGHDPSEQGRNRSDAYINSLHALARKLSVHERLRFPGHVAPESIMNEIDILVHPTEFESFGRVAVEAMAAGVPVVGARGGGMAEIVEHGKTGLLFEPNDSADLARCVEALLTNRELADRLAAHGRERAQREYDIGATARKVAQVYREVLECAR